MSRRAFSVGVFLVDKDCVLLIKHKLLGLWLPVGGEMNDGETPAEAAARETKEETGQDVIFPDLGRSLDGQPPGLIGYEEHPAGPKGMHMNFNFVAIPRSRDIVGDGSFSAAIWHPIMPVDHVRLDSPMPKSVQQCITRIWHMRKEGRLP